MASCGTTRPSGASSWAHNAHAGWPRQPGRWTTGSPPATPRRDHGPLCRCHRPCRPCCRTGRQASGSASCATAPRMSCWRSPASTSARGLPLSVIVIDFFHWPRMGDWDWDPAVLARPGGHGARAGGDGREADGLGLAGGEPHAASNARGDAASVGCWCAPSGASRCSIRFRDTGRSGRIYCHYYDATNPEARRFIWEQDTRELLPARRQGLLAGCLRAGDLPARLRQHALSPGTGAEVASIYPLLHEQGFYEGMQAAGETGDHHPLPLRLGGQPALRRCRLVGRHPLDLRDAAAAGAGRPEHRPERHPLVDHRHRRLLRRRYPHDPTSAS